MSNFHKDWLSKSVPALIGIAVFVGILLACFSAWGQAIVVDPAPPIPAEPQTWGEALALIWPKLVQTFLAGVSVFLTVAIHKGVSLLPEWIAEWIEAKRQRDLHSAVMSKVAELITQGRWPTAGEIGVDILDELRNHANISTPRATQHFEIMQPSPMSDAVFKALGERFGLELDPLRGALAGALGELPVAAPPAPPAHVPQVPPAGRR